MEFTSKSKGRKIFPAFTFILFSNPEIHLQIFKSPNLQISKSGRNYFNGLPSSTFVTVIF